MNNIIQLLASEDLEKDVNLFFISSGEFIFTYPIEEFVEIDGFKFKINKSIAHLYEYFAKDPKEINLLDIINLDESDLGICPKFAVIYFITANYQKHITQKNFDKLLEFMVRVAKTPITQSEYRLHAELSATKFGGFSFLGYLEDIGVLPLHLFSFKTQVKRAGMSEKDVADCESSIQNGVKSLKNNGSDMTDNSKKPPLGEARDVVRGYKQKESRTFFSILSACFNGKN